MIKNIPQASGNSSKSKYVPGLLVVRWKDDVLGHMPMAKSGRGARLSLPDNVSDPLKAIRERFGLKQVIDINTGEHAAPQRNVRRSMSANATSITKSLDPSTGALRGVTVLELDSDKESDVLAAAEILREDSSIIYAEPAARRWIAAKRTNADPEFNLQWSLPAIKWPGTKRPRASKVNVGILDSGVDRMHPDLKKSIKFYDHAGVSSEDLIGHGTHVAGIIAAGLNNKVGIAGIADCRLHCWKVFSDAGKGDNVDNVLYYQALGSILNRAGKDQIHVLNLSIGGTEFDRTEELLIRRLIDKGVLVVGAMGNEYLEDNPIEYPAALADVIAVGAIKQNMTRASFSNTGSHIKLVAPGVSILSTVPMKKSRVRSEVKYESWDGTSMATPIIAAAVALMIAKYPKYSADDIRKRITSHKFTTHLDAMKGRKRTNEYGSGLLNLKLALG